jgi:hypothetical protein
MMQGNAMTNFRTAAMAFVVAAAMMGSQALADGALAPGKPAGVSEAQRHHSNLLLIGGVTAAVIAGVVIAATSGGSASCSAAACPTSVASTSTAS